MRQFIYGRFDVTQGVRGYEIFDRDRAVPRDTVKTLLDLFSTKDPDPNLLRNLGAFYVYFPLNPETWVFGRGGYEERSNYYSYVLRGVLLDEAERAALDYNPFSLAPLLDPQIGDNRRLPQNPVPDLHRGILKPNPSDSLQRIESGLLHYAAADIADAVLACPSPKSTAPTFPYDKRLDSDFWLLCYHFLPRTVRANLSLASLDLFLHHPTHLRGLSSDANTTISLEQPRRTNMGRFLNDTAALEPDVIAEHFDILEATKADALFLWDKQQRQRPDETEPFPRWYLNFCSGVFKGMEKEAVSSLKWWKDTPTHVHLFPKKVAHYLKVHARFADEIQAWFPNLERDILHDLKDNFKTLAADAEPEALRPIGKCMNTVVSMLGVVQKSDLAADLLENPGLAQQWLPRMEDHVLVAALANVNQHPTTFQQLLNNIIAQTDGWRPFLDQIWTMSALYLCRPAVHAKLLDLLPAKQSSHFYIESLCNHRYLKMPADFSLFYQSLQNKRLLSRFINHFRKQFMGAGPDRDNWFQLLGIARELDPNATREACKKWINYRYSERFLDALPRHPALCDFLLETWLESAADERALLRVGLLITRRGSSAKHLLTHPRLAHALKHNKMFKILLAHPDIMLAGGIH